MLKSIIGENIEQYILKRIDEAVIIINNNGQIDYVNNKGEEFISSSETDINDRDVSHVFYNENFKYYNNKLNDFIIEAITNPEQPISGKIKYPHSQEKIVLEVNSKFLKAQNNHKYIILIIKDITKVEKLTTLKNDFALILTLTLGAICLQNLFLIVGENLFGELPPWITSRFIEILGIFIFIITILFTSLSFSDLGLVVPKKKLYPTIINSVLISLALIFLMVMARLYLPGIFGITTDTPFFDPHFEEISQITYFLIAPLQEFISKGVIQNSIIRVFNKPNPLLGILATSMIFMVLHFHYGLMMMLVAFFMSVSLGYLFNHDKNIWGCSIIHFTIGFFPYCFGLITF